MSFHGPYTPRDIKTVADVCGIFPLKAYKAVARRNLKVSLDASSTVFPRALKSGPVIVNLEHQSLPLFN
jgi:hypothetical protein